MIIQSESNYDIYYTTFSLLYDVRAQYHTNDNHLATCNWLQHNSKVIDQPNNFGEILFEQVLTHVPMFHTFWLKRGFSRIELIIGILSWVIF